MTQSPSDGADEIFAADWVNHLLGALKETANITGDERLATLGANMTEIGDAWQQVRKTLRQAHDAPDPAAPLPEATRPLPDIADHEQAAWEKLREIANRN